MNFISKRYDLTGKTFGKLTVIEKTHPPENLSTAKKRIYWRCRCECGNILVTTTDRLNNGKSKQCEECGRIESGLKRRKDLTGKRFGHLVVKRMIYDHKDDNGRNRTLCECECDCGNIVTKRMEDLNPAIPQSCGCSYQEVVERKVHNVIGETFDRLTVLDEYTKDGYRKVLCRCVCGTVKEYVKTEVTSGGTKSCGCLHRERTSIANTKDWTGYISDAGVVAIKRIKKNDKGQWLWEWKCPLCGNTFLALPAIIANNHTTSCGCQIQSSGEKIIKHILEKNHIEFIPQYSFDDCKYKYKLKFDFAIFKNGKVFLLVEFDGKQHFEPIKFFGGEENFAETKIRDSIKNEYCVKNNIPLLRINYTTSKEEIENQIMNAIYP